MSQGLPTQFRRRGTLETDQVRDFTTLPLAPREVFVTASFLPNSLDIRWENPASIHENMNLNIVGVNVYRSYDDELGHYVKLNPSPLGALFYRDTTKNVLVIDEVVTFDHEGDSPTEDWVFTVANFPIVKSGSQAVIARDPSDVVVKVDGVTVRAKKVVGESGEVFLIATGWWDHAAQVIVPATLPGPGDVTTCSYYWNDGVVVGTPDRRLFYRVTAVLDDDSETPLEETYPHQVEDVEEVDYIWAEAMRRNAWILDQGGERVMVFLRRWMGDRCECYDYDHENPRQSCQTCYGTGYVGGYDGPYELTVSPSNVRKSRKLTPQGYVPDDMEEVWTGREPTLAHWDFMLKNNGERYSIGPVTVPTARGARLQQHFNIRLLEEVDIRYKVPVSGQDTTPVADSGYTEFRGSPDDPEEPPAEPDPDTLTDASPLITEKPEVPEGRRRKGRTITYDAIEN